MTATGNSLVVHWLGLHAFTAEGPGSIPGQETRINQDPTSCSEAWPKGGGGRRGITATNTKLQLRKVLQKTCKRFILFYYYFFLNDFFFFFFYFILFIYLWLCWVFVSVRGLSLAVASGGHSSSRCAGLSLSRPLSLRSTGSRRAGSATVAHRPSCSAARGIFPDQGSNPCALHWQADSQPLRHQGSPCKRFY